VNSRVARATLRNSVSKKQKTKNKKQKTKTKNQNQKPKKNKQKTVSGAGEMAQCFRALTALPEVLSSIPSNYMVAHNHL
jgi:ethanolamine utilization cobalamin adenosyltransferase